MAGWKQGHKWRALLASLVYITLPSGVMSLEGYCEFPEYLWLKSPQINEQTWIMRPIYADGNLTSLREVTAAKRHITVTSVRFNTCAQNTNNTSAICQTQEVTANYSCLSVEYGEKYRVQLYTDSSSWFTCLKFVKVNKNIVLIWEAPQDKMNEDRLCYDEVLQHHPWPLFAERQKEWSFSPLQGGYDITSFNRTGDEKTQLCRHQWRPSRLESECARGEGLHFFFPHSRCSFFSNKSEFVQLYSWGNWTDGDRNLMLLGEHGQYPRYTLEYPDESPSVHHYTAYLYPDGAVSRTTDSPRLYWDEHYSYIELVMRRSEPGECYDESPSCARYASDGSCTGRDWHRYAMFCKKSCGLCDPFTDFVPSSIAECEFPNSFQAKWYLVEDSWVEEVTIGVGFFNFTWPESQLICKSRHHESALYKMFSTYRNGCRPRYTCVQFRRDDEALLFRMSRSDRTDRSFDLCEFRDDPLPLGGQIRSSSYKILLPQKRTEVNSCGLHGRVSTEASYPDGTLCEGTVSDWSTSQCNATQQLRLNVAPCPTHGAWRRFTCVAFVHLGGLDRVLITNENNFDKPSYQCWLIDVNRLEPTRRLWSKAYLLPRGQCGSQRDFRHDDPSSYSLTLDITSGYQASICPNDRQPFFSISPSPPSYANLGYEHSAGYTAKPTIHSERTSQDGGPHAEESSDTRSATYSTHSLGGASILALLTIVGLSSLITAT